jgi:23S rRNA (cytosine1962-C5)-methyltransferase
VSDAILVKNLRRAIKSGHPWVYRDALRPFRAPPGEVVTVRDAKKAFVARGIAEEGPIAVRVWTTANEPIDEAFVRRRVAAAVALRRQVTPADTDAVRLLNGEGDRLGGVHCDRYGRHALLRFDGAGAVVWREAVLAALLAEVEALDGVAMKTGRRGETTVEAIAGTLPDGPIEVREHGMRLLVDLQRGQKTGLFLDHRDSRRLVRQLARGLRVMNLYGYTGGFSIAAGLGGAAKVRTVDVAGPALALAERGWALNGLGPSLHETVKADVPKLLESEAPGAWDLIVSDPPSFAPKESAVPAALESYRALHRRALELLGDGGLLLAASCSSHVGREAFETTVIEGASQARVVLQILGRWGADLDHPRMATFPESDYLKVLLCRVCC